MYYELMKLKTEMDMTKFTLKDLALYFEKFDGYVCKITTNRGIIRFKFSSSSFPHLIGLQYAYKNRKDKREYKGISGFNKVKNGEITYEQVKNNIKKNPNLPVSWKNVDERIKFLPMFLNSLVRKTKLRTSIGNVDKERVTHIQGNYFLYRELHDGKTPMLSLKSLTNHAVVIETFVVDSDKSIIKNLNEIKIKDIELISPLENTAPIILKEDKYKQTSSQQ